MIQTIRNVWREALIGFCALHRIQFSAPWNSRQGGCRAR